MLELRAIRQAFGERTVLAGVDLHVAAGQTVAILGASGSGKSTLLKIVAGLQVPAAGHVYIDGQDMARIPPEHRGCALMFQDFALFPHLDVLDNVAFGLVEQGHQRRAAREQARALLELFGLAAFAPRRVWLLSGGEQQRVALARALITRPRVLLLDEPFSALDTSLRETLREEFHARIRQAGMASILVTHDEAEARTLATRAFKLEGGVLLPISL